MAGQAAGLGCGSTPLSLQLVKTLARPRDPLSSAPAIPLQRPLTDTDLPWFAKEEEKEEAVGPAAAVGLVVELAELEKREVERGGGACVAASKGRFGHENRSRSATPPTAAALWGLLLLSGTCSTSGLRQGGS